MKDKSEQLILVLEGDEYTRDGIVTVFELEGYCVAGAADGVMGLAEARRLRPDLIVCAADLPGLDGYGVLAALRGEPETSSIPFVFLGRRSGPNTSLFRSGIDEYLAKPIDIEDLIGAVVSGLERRSRNE